MLLLCLVVNFAACRDDSSDEQIANDQEYVDDVLSKMSLHEKVGQMFWIRPEYLLEDVASGKQTPTTADWPTFNVTSLTAEMKELYEQYPAGGIILFAHNCVDPQQLKTFMPQLKALKNAPLLCIDEEGGRVARIANNEKFGLNKFESMSWLCQNGGESTVYIRSISRSTKTVLSSQSSLRQISRPYPGS